MKYIFRLDMLIPIKQALPRIGQKLLKSKERTAAVDAVSEKKTQMTVIYRGVQIIHYTNCPRVKHSP
jgi:hypothetical protein